MQFDLNRNIDGAARDVQAALNAALADLPSDLPTLPSFRKANPAALPILILALTSKTVPPSAIYDAADTVVAQRIAQVPGVAEVTVSGAEQPAIRVRVDPARVAAAGHLARGGAHRDRRRQRAEPARRASTAPRRPRPSRPTTSCADARGLPDLVVKRANGNVVRLSRHRHGRAERRATAARPAWFNGEPAVLLIITKQGDANVIETVDRIRALLPELQRWIPAGIDIAVLSDRTRTIRASVARHAGHAGRHRSGW